MFLRDLRVLNLFGQVLKLPPLLELKSSRRDTSHDTATHSADGRECQLQLTEGVSTREKRRRTVPSTTTAFHQTHSSSSSDHSLLSLSRQIGQGLSPRPPAGGTGTFFFMSDARSIELPAVPFDFVGDEDDPARSEGSDANVGEDALSEVYQSCFENRDQLSAVCVQDVESLHPPSCTNFALVLSMLLLGSFACR